MEYAHAIALSVNMYTLNCVHIERVQLLSKAQQLHCPWLCWPFLCLFCGLLHNLQKRVALTVERRWGQVPDVTDQADVSVVCLTLTQLTQLSFYDLIFFLNDN